MELGDILVKIRQREEQLAWEGTFSEYFQMAVKNPAISHLAHKRIYDMIASHGTVMDDFGRKQYQLFDSQLFGLEKPINQVVNYFNAAANRLETRKRILLLLGPPASGKTTLANTIKNGLEKYTRTDQGALYAIKGCPMQEEPLHLIPSEFREGLMKQYNIYIEGDLCPHCRWTLRHVYKGNIEQVKVQRVSISEQMGMGIGTFVASDPGSQEITRLTGHVNPMYMSEDRIESFGKAFFLNGEFDVANRGIMEFIEMFKMSDHFLAPLLVLTEEQKIKAPGLGSFYADEAIMAHSNEAEYDALVTNKKTEALQDRIIVVRVPYNLRVSEEIKIYQKLLKKIDLKDVHISPLCLPVASTFAVLSRLEPSERFRISFIKKMHLYDGQYTEGYTKNDADEMQDEAVREGMIGISPRFVINQIARAVSRPGIACLDALDLLLVIWDGIENSTNLAREERQRLYNLFLDTRREYDAIAFREVQKASVDQFDKSAAEMLNEYLDNLLAYMEEKENGGIKDTEENHRRENLLQSYERSIGIHDYDNQNFRKEIGAKAVLMIQSGLKIDYQLDSRLEDLVVKKLCPGKREISNVLNTNGSGDSTHEVERNNILRRLQNDHGYADDCAVKLLDYVEKLLNNHERRKRPSLKSLRWLTD